MTDKPSGTLEAAKVIYGVGQAWTSHKIQFGGHFRPRMTRMSFIHFVVSIIVFSTIVAFCHSLELLKMFLRVRPNLNSSSRFDLQRKKWDRWTGTMRGDSFGQCNERNVRCRICVNGCTNSMPDFTYQICQHLPLPAVNGKTLDKKLVLVIIPSASSYVRIQRIFLWQSRFFLLWHGCGVFCY